MQRFNFQFTGQRFYAIAGRRARRPAARRRLPGDHDRLLGLDGGGRRRRDLGARRRVQLRQGPTRPGRGGQPRLPDRAVPRRHASSTPSTRQATDDHAHPAAARRARARSVAPPTTASRSSATVTSANLRWANNTLTTNGVMTGVDVTVISFVDGRDGVATGSVTGSADARPSRSRPSSQAADAAARAGRAGRGRGRAGRRRRSRRLGRRARARPSIDVYDAFAPALGEAFGARDGRGPAALRLRQPRGRRRPTSARRRGLRLRHVQPTGHFACTGKTDDLVDVSAWVGGATRDFPDVDAAGARRRARPAAGLGGAPASTCPPVATTRSCRRPSVADLMIDAYWGAGARVAHEGAVGLQPAAAAAPGSASGSPRPASRCSPTRPTPGSSARRS